MENDVLAQRIADAVTEKIRKDGDRVSGAKATLYMEALIKKHIANYKKENDLDDEFDIKIAKRDGVDILKPVYKERKRLKGITTRKLKFYQYALKKEGVLSAVIFDSESKNYFADAIQQFIFSGKAMAFHHSNTSKLLIPEGVYLLKRQSFNRQNLGQITVIRVWIYPEENARGQIVYKYTAVNWYRQSSVTGAKAERLRNSTGYIIPNQYNMLMIGKTHYKDLHKWGEREQDNVYPEVISISIDPAASDYLGLVLANFPDYRKPVCVQCQLKMASAADQKKFKDREQYIKKELYKSDDACGIKSLDEFDEDISRVTTTKVDKGIKMLIPVPVI